MEGVLEYICCSILVLWVVIWISWLVYASIIGVVDDGIERLAILWPILMVPVIIMILYDELKERTS